MRTIKSYAYESMSIDMGEYGDGVVVMERHYNNVPENRSKGFAKKLYASVFNDHYPRSTIYAFIFKGAMEAERILALSKKDYGFKECSADELANIMVEGGVSPLSLPDPETVYTIKREPLR